MVGASWKRYENSMRSGLCPSPASCGTSSRTLLATKLPLPGAAVGAAAV